MKKEKDYILVGGGIVGILILVFVLFVGSNSHQDDQNEQEKEGYWIQTASVDWCELNYVHSFYIAEYWNTLSNISFATLAGLGLFYHTWMEPRYALCFLSTFAIGLGSALFHGTLMWIWQLFDELPMLYMILVSLYSCLEHNKVKTNSRSHIMAIGFALFSCIFTAIYCAYPYPAIFQITWGIITVYTVFQMAKVSLQVPPQERFAIRSCVIVMLSAAVCWVIEQAYCSPFIRWFRLHAVWHVGMSYSAYNAVVNMLYIREKVILKRYQVELYFVLGIIPVIEKSNKPIAAQD